MTQAPRGALAIAISAVVVAGLAACGPQSASPESTTLKTSALNYHIAGNWNPVTSDYLNIFFAPQQAVYEPLIRLNAATFEYEPVLAEEFEISEDLHSIDITLRQDVDFSDGTHLDAEAVRAYFDAIEEATTGYFASVGFYERYGLRLEITGEYELTFSSDLPMDSDFMYNFAIVPIVSPTAIAEDPEGLETTPVGTGPYLLEEQVAEVSARFVRNPDYRDADAYAFDEVEFLVFADSIAASNALKSGQIDVANLDPSLAADAASNGFDIRAGGGFNYVLVWSDPDGSIVPELADPRVRQAIAYSLDRASITESINLGYGSVTSQVWGPGSPHHVEGGDDRYAYDLDRAKDLMKEAGYEAGFAVTMPTTAILAAYEPVLIQAFADLGITLTFEQVADIFELTEVTARGVDRYAMHLWQTADLYAASQVVRPSETVTGFPQLADEYEVVDTGTADEVADALQAIGETVLEEALVIAVARPLDTWATIPEITLDVGIITGWPPLLQSYRPAD